VVCNDQIVLALQTAPQQLVSVLWKKLAGEPYIFRWAVCYASAWGATKFFLNRSYR
jgi:hypothetical protein